eukprot:UN01763
MSAITCQAMVLREKGKMNLETITVAPPKQNQVRLKTLYSSCCHTDLLVIEDRDPETPIAADNGVILGHEGIFVVESVGEGVTDVAVGDYVIGSYIPECKSCRFCSNPNTNLCSTIRVTQGNGQLPDGTTPFTDAQGKPIRMFMGLSAFSQYSTVSAWSVCKVPADILEAYKDKMSHLALYGCGVTTGYGSAVSSKIFPGASVCIVGLGGVGLAAVVGAKASGAGRIFGVDINPAKKDLAMKLGVTDFINPKELPEGMTLEQKIVEECDGWGCDFSFECVGNVNLMTSCLKMVVKGTGKAYVIGVATGASVEARSFLFVSGRSLSGFAFGNISPSGIPDVIRGFDKIAAIEDFVTGERPLSEVNEAFEDMHNGLGIRTVIKME